MVRFKYTKSGSTKLQVDMVYRHFTHFLVSHFLGWGTGKKQGGVGVGGRVEFGGWGQCGWSEVGGVGGRGVWSEVGGGDGGVGQGGLAVI